MKAIVRHANRPTTESIARFFGISAKRHLLLTGAKGSGKTTLLNRLIPLLAGESVPGITTWAEQGRAVWLRENNSAHVAQIGAFDTALLHCHMPPMRPVMEGFCGLGIAALERCRESAGEWASIDEIGFLEAGCSAYCDAIRSLMEKKRVIAAVRKQELPFLEELKARKDVCVIDLDKPFGQLGCVIMASGMGRRFGGNKLMADFGGRPMLRHILDATGGMFARRIVVTRHADVEAFCRERGIPVIVHSMPQRSDTVRIGLGAVGEDISGCMFCPGDQPLLTRETVETMALAAVFNGESIWQLRCGETPGTPVIFPRWAFRDLRNLPEGKGGNVVIKKHSESVRFVPARDYSEMMDVDSPEDMHSVLNAMKRRP